jgi:hypothetical protein
MVASSVIKKVIFGFLILFICLFIIFTYLEIRFANQIQNTITTNITVKEAYLCTFEKDKWIQKEIFTVKENIYICLKIKTNNPINGFLFQIYVFEDNIKPTNKSIYGEEYSYSINDKYIPINYEFSPGKYYIAVHYIRLILAELPIEIIDEKSP